MNVLDYCAAETKRQHGTMREAIGMYVAWDLANRRWNNGFRLTESALKHFFQVIKNDGVEYRNVPALFDQGMPAVPAAHVPVAMQRLGDVLNSVDSEKHGALFDNPREIADYLTREFLLIHPFTDGNGRVGSLMWNFLNGSIADPEPMPYFFGEA